MSSSRLRRREITAARDAAKQDLADQQNALIETGVRASALREEAAEVNAELRSLRERKTNIPRKQLELRAAAVPRAAHLARKRCRSPAS